MKIISLNIELNRHHNLVLPFLKRENPDVVCLQEVLEEDFEMYKRELGMQGVQRLTSYISDNVHPESKGKREGTAIFTNKIEDSGYIFHVWNEDVINRTFEEYIKEINLVKPRALLWVDVKDKSGETYRFVTSHLTITHHGEVSADQLEANEIFIKQIKELGEFVFCGDTNAPRGFDSYARIANEFKDNIPALYKSSLDKDLHRAKGFDYMIDCLFTTQKYVASNVELKGGISDHMAVVAEINKI